MSLVNFLNVPVRSARARVMLQGNDITQRLDPSSLSFSYSDHAEGQGDSIDFELEDKDRTWIGENFPLKGSKIEAYIAVTNWRRIGDNMEQRCGSFTIDSVFFKGPPNTVAFKANSIPTNTKIKGTNFTRAWENTTFQEVAQQMATENGMQIQWESQEQPQYKRLEQMDQSDLAFLQDHADEIGLAMKVTDNKIVFFDESEYESRPAVDTIRSGVNVVVWQFHSSLTDTVRATKVDYLNPETGQLTSENFNGGVLTGNEKFLFQNPGYESDAPKAAGTAFHRFAPVPAIDLSQLVGWKHDDPAMQMGKGMGGKKVAARRARKMARKANKRENQATFVLVGNPLLCAGKTVNVEGFGQFDGKYMIQTTRHQISRAGYTTDVRLTLTLGY